MNQDSDSSVLRRAAKGGVWFASFRLATQTFSWLATIAIARMLVPEDYGLMAIASLLTGYVEIFSELGLGAAIIQRQAITQRELSSNFWFSVLLGVGFAVVSFGLAYPTAWIFNEPRVIPITQLISVLFVVGALMIVPFNILMRELRFKAIGAIQLLAVAIASSSMLWMAARGFGVWTLINGTIIQRSSTVLLAFVASRFRPDLCFQFSDVRPLLRFGVNVAGARSLFYIFQKSDKFIVGKVLGVQALGFYSFAMQLASIPTDKIVSIVNQVSYPVMSRFQRDLQRTREIYLRVTRYTSLVVSPLFLAGAVFGEELILALLGPKWVGSIFLFRVFCLSQLVVSLTAINNAVHSSFGRPQWVVYFHLVSLLLMAPSLFVVVQYGVNALWIPWLIIYPSLCIGFSVLTLRKLDIPVGEYLKHVLPPLIASAVMIAGIKSMMPLVNAISKIGPNLTYIIVQEVVIGVMIYLAYLIAFERKTLLEIWSIRKV